ncbi:DUF1801 domain-containing protein [Dactylosporangium sp. NPDC049525]|uniref:DUF1801 domain-containing protein n=1 Tax=Dactylosporangium sp. NPDC049525 TaxID=3154730 RepID=UPI00343D0658
MTGQDVTDYVQNRLSPNHRDIVLVLRELVTEVAPTTSEVISRGSLAWKGNQILAIISQSRTHLTLAFARGAEFTDEHGLLDGIGKNTRHIKIKSLETIPRAAVRDYLQQAVALDRT